MRWEYARFELKSTRCEDAALREFGIPRSTPPRDAYTPVIWRYRNQSCRVLLVIGLCATVLLAWALLWRSGDLPAPGQDLDGRQEEAATRSERSSEPVLIDSPEPDEATGSLWVEVDESTLAILPPYAEDWSAEGRALVEVSDIDRLWAAQPGDLLALPVPQLGTTYRAVVEEIDQGTGARALVGTITGSDGDRRRSVVTVGPTSLFAFIDTPNGTYEFAIDLGLYRHGWLVPTSSMLAGWDFSEPDYFIARDGDAGGAIAP